LESESSTIEVKEVPTEAVGNMLEYIYIGKFHAGGYILLYENRTLVGKIFKIF
jgi:hypothetical protein